MPVVSTDLEASNVRTSVAGANQHGRPQFGGTVLGGPWVQ